MKFGFVINDLATEKAEYTTVRLAMAASNRGHESWLLGVADFVYLRDGSVHAYACGTGGAAFASAAEFLELCRSEGARKRICVDGLDVRDYDPDLLWQRETSGGVFDTPERRAELERTLRELSSRIRDESVRFHYSQEMRDRVHSFFGASRGGRPGRSGERDRGQGGRRGQWDRGTSSGRLAVSESLARSALVKKAVA